jgi:1-acyl-sn-glycerol-3-phosphate acyltransferase
MQVFCPEKCLKVNHSPRFRQVISVHISPRKRHVYSPPMSVFTTPVLTPILRGLARVLLRMSGWRVEPDARMQPPFVFIGAPHTSNWDFVLLLGAMLVLRLDVHWMGKHTLFRFPFGGLMRWLGGIPVNRSAPQNLVAEVVAAFARDPQLIVCIPPEGTRKKVARWKTGFYRIAHGAGVPIMMTVIDAQQRSLRLLDVFHPTGDMDHDLPRIQRHYVGFGGLRPEQAYDFPHLRG